MQELFTEWPTLSINITIALLATFLVDFLVTRHLIKNVMVVPADSDDKPQSKEKNYFYIGILPGIATLLILNMPILLDALEFIFSSILIVVYAILTILASYAGGIVASFTTKQTIEADFDPE